MDLRINNRSVAAHKPKKQVIVITLDAVRADHLSLYGYKRNTTPELKMFSRDAAVYTRCLSPASYTLASMFSIFNGLSPLSHSLRFGFQKDGRPFSVRRSDFPMITSLRAKGAATAIFTSNPLTSSAYLLGLNTVVDHLDDNYKHLTILNNKSLYFSPEVLINSATTWISAHKDKDFFIWIHLMAAHGPYMPKEKRIFTSKKPSKRLDRIIYDFQGEYFQSYEKKLATPGIPYYQVQGAKYDAGGELIDYEKRVNYYVDKYDTGISTMDAALGKLFSCLNRLEIYDSSMVVVHSDHGESLGEHNVYFNHGHSSTLELIHVPLIIKNPHYRKHMTVDTFVSQAGILADIYRYFGVSPGAAITPSVNNQHASNSLYSVGPKSMAILANGLLYVIHNGSLNPYTQPEERLFPLEARVSHKSIQKENLFIIVYDTSGRYVRPKHIPEIVWKIVEQNTLRRIV